MKISLYFMLFISCKPTFQDTGFTREQVNNIKSYSNNIIDCLNVTGLSVAVVKNGQVYTEGFGVANREDKTPVTNSTKMNIGSVTKSLTSLLLAILISDAKERKDTSINWNSKVQKILDSSTFMLSDDCITKTVSLEDFLSHRTGFTSADIMLQAGISGDRTNDDIVRNFKDLEFIEEFRDVFSYSNIGYVMVGRLAEKIGKKSWESLLKDKLFGPLGMDSTVFLNKDTFHDLAKPYIYVKDKGIQDTEDEIYLILDQFGPAGGICSTANDMSKVMLYLTSQEQSDQLRIEKDIFDHLFKQKSVVPTSFRKRYSYSSPPFPVSLEVYGYGLAWFLSSYRGMDVYFHTGGLYGFTSVLGFVPSKNISVFLNSNGLGKPGFSHTMLPTMYYIIDTLLDDVEPWLNETTACTFPSPWKPEESNDNSTKGNETQNDISNSERFVGNYSNPLYGEFKVFLENKTLQINYGRLLKGTLSHHRDNLFNLTVLEPLSNVVPADNTVKFENLSGELFQTVRVIQQTIFVRLSSNVSSVDQLLYSVRLCLIAVVCSLTLGNRH